MIIREKLKGACSEFEAATVYNELKEEGNLADFCKQYMYDEDYQVARNSFWALTKATNKELSQLQPMYNDIVELAMSHENSSLRRLSLNIIERLKMQEDELRTDFLDFCLEHMTNINEFPGIQSLCMKLAFRMCKFYPELMDEFHRTIDAMEMSFYTPAVKSIRNKILNGKMK